MTKSFMVEMENRNSPPEENLVGKIQNLFNGYYGNDNQNYLLLIISLRDFSLRALNKKGLRYFGELISAASSNELFEQVVHPDDFPHFQHFLRTSRDLDYSDERLLRVRLKAPPGYWKTFVFNNRLYKGLEQDGEKFLLCIGKAADSEKSIFYKNSSLTPEVEKYFQENLYKYKTVLGSLSHGFALGEMVFDLRQQPLDYLYLETNPAFEVHTNSLDPVGQGIREFPQLQEFIEFEKLAEVTQSGEGIHYESYSGHYEKWFNIHIFPVALEKIQKVGILFSDITEQKVAEENLRKTNAGLEQQITARTGELEESHDLLQMIFDTVNQGIFLLKPVLDDDSEIVDFEYVRVNKKVLRYYNRGELVGQSFLKLNPQASKTGAFEIFKQTMLSGESRDFEVNIKRKGNDSWFKITTRRQKGLLINSLENITRRKQRAQDLKENIRFKKQLIKTTPDLILIFNLYDEKIRFLNRDLTDDPALTKEELIGKPLLDLLPLIHPQDRKKAMDFHETILKAADKDIVELEFRFRSKDRSWQHFNARAKIFMRNKNGKVYEYLVLLRNVQEQKLVQKALLHAEKLSIKGEIARTLAHELRNPIASIGMSADILEKMVVKPEMKPLNNYLGIIKRSTSTLNKLVTELLTASNYSPPVFKKCCLAKVTNKALANAKDRIYLTGVKVIKKYRSPYYINADEEKLQIALLNIIVNASEAMLPDEGVLILIIKKKKETFELSIADNGCGMEQEQLDRLFESFYTQKPEGMGIGLNSVKNILDDHGATIQVESVPKEGTSFILTFPCHEDVVGK